LGTNAVAAVGKGVRDKRWREVSSTADGYGKNLRECSSNEEEKGDSEKAQWS